LLQPFIYCYWQLRTTHPLPEEFKYKVVSDGCIDIFFDLNDPRESYVMGFSKRYAEFPLERSFHYAGIRFLPTMLPQLYRVNAASLSNTYLRLDNILPEIAVFIAGNFNARSNTEQIQSCFDDHFLEHLSKVELNTDKRLYEAIDVILKNAGRLSVETDLDTGLSPRQLRRLFEFYIGASAKTFAQVVRFQHVLRQQPSMTSIREDKLFIDAGYYDQAHFIREFKNFYGITPGEALPRLR
jgi:AraC-like DNA-binding protein